MADSEAPLARALATLARRHDLTVEDAEAAFGEIMRGEVSETRIAALLMGLRVKGETATEVAGAVRALRAAMVRVDAGGDRAVIDTCGTGGGTVSTFNISTAAALVAAAAGASVTKHGNRSFTSRCGSADVLEALGVGLIDDASRARDVLREAGIVFLFAPHFHPAMRHVGGVRRDLAVPTIMNILGPLANPAGATRQILGIADPDRGPLLADAL